MVVLSDPPPGGRDFSQLQGGVVLAFHSLSRSDGSSLRIPIFSSGTSLSGAEGCPSAKHVPYRSQKQGFGEALCPTIWGLLPEGVYLHAFLTGWAEPTHRTKGGAWHVLRRPVFQAGRGCTNIFAGLNAPLTLKLGVSSISCVFFYLG